MYWDWGHNGKQGGFGTNSRGLPPGLHFSRGIRQETRKETPTPQTVLFFPFKVMGYNPSQRAWQGGRGQGSDMAQTPSRRGAWNDGPHADQAWPLPLSPGARLSPKLGSLAFSFSP